VIVFIGILSNLDVSFRPTSLFNTLLMLVLLFDIVIGSRLCRPLPRTLSFSPIAVPGLKGRAYRSVARFAGFLTALCAIPKTVLLDARQQRKNARGAGKRSVGPALQAGYRVAKGIEPAKRATENCGYP
jgi:hypothetical protein